MYVCRMAWGVEVAITERVWYMCVVCGAWRVCVEVGFVCYGVCVRARVCVLCPRVHFAEGGRLCCRKGRR